ncbi:hypothetical protein [Streptomyces sp. NPDC051109]|uniref:hypothetical protein n=1 Tax=Streptomyces sp. NPDC051109 TaxID=3365642 RepID=UPI0037BBF2CE
MLVVRPGQDVCGAGVLNEERGRRMDGGGTMAPWAAAQSAVHLRELVLFLSVHLDRAPGVLWPEFEHPALSAPEWSQVLDGLALELGPGAHLVARSGGTGNPAAHRVVHQVEGAGTWRLSGEEGAPGADGFQCRLRSGEVLYIPARWSWSVELTSGGRYVLTDLTPRPQPPQEVSHGSIRPSPPASNSVPVREAPVDWSTM